MRKVVVYSKDDCHLCDKVISKLEKLRATESFDLTTQDITEDPALFERYKNIIPVVAIDGRVKLAGAALSNPNLDEVLKRTIITINVIMRTANHLPRNIIFQFFKLERLVISLLVLIDVSAWPR